MALRRENIIGLTRISAPIVRKETIQRYCMKKTIDHMLKVLENHNISIPEGARKDDSRDNTEDHDERCPTLKATFSKSHAFLIDSRASNHMVASKESLLRIIIFITNY